MNVIYTQIYISISVFLSTYRRFYRFLALKNLAAVFLQQGSTHYENALRCYLQAVEIDSKDSVVWNRLGTLSCLMGSLSISRWAFEQGLSCSPNNCKHLILLDLNKSFYFNGYLMECFSVFLVCEIQFFVDLFGLSLPFMYYSWVSFE